LALLEGREEAYKLKEVGIMMAPGWSHHFHFWH